MINRRENILSFIDQDIVAKLMQSMEGQHIKLLLGREVTSVLESKSSKNERVINVNLGTGEKLNVDMVLFAAARRGNTAGLNLESLGIDVDKQGLIRVNENYQTTVPNVYAVGDVIGFPSLASTGMGQGLAAVAHIYQLKKIFKKHDNTVPYGIYTIPEISTAGISEEKAKELNLSYGSSFSRYIDLPRGKILDDKIGTLKLVYSKEDFVIIGVHVIGASATEIINHGVDLIENKNTLYDVVDRIYNFPTLHELYKRAALIGLAQHFHESKAKNTL